MFGIRRPRTTWWLRETLLVVAALLLGLLFVTQVRAADAPVTRKTARQIDVMERIIDQVLVDSPNFLVQGRDNARGLYLEEFGVLFTFDASLVSDGGGDISKIFKKWDGKGFRIETDDDGDRVLVIPDFSSDENDKDADEGADKDADEDTDGDVDKDDAKDLRTWRDREVSRGERLYKRGKAEIVDVLLDYGDTLTTLPGDSWVAIVAFLRDSNYFEKQKISKLILKAKLDDLRKYASDGITEEEMIKRIVEQEY